MPGRELKSSKSPNLHEGLHLFNVLRGWRSWHLINRASEPMCVLRHHQKLDGGAWVSNSLWVTAVLYLPRVPEKPAESCSRHTSSHVNIVSSM